MSASGKKIIMTAIGVLFLMIFMIFPLLSLGEHEHGSHPERKDNGASPLIEEMIKLDAVFRDVVSGVAMGDNRRVHEALETMHGTMEKTHEGVHHGTVVMRKNADRLNEFIALDKRFHEKLEQLAHAAQINDQKVMVGLTKELLDGCVSCHRDFRQP
jgi:cytochrome c556